MPVSVKRHNLARLRKELEITQTELARLLRCSSATIRAVEIGKLPLSESLAERIAAATGVDPIWLRRNDLAAAMPPRKSGYILSPEERIRDNIQYALSLCAGAIALAKYLKDEGSQNLLFYRLDQFGDALRKLASKGKLSSIVKRQGISTEKELLESIRIQLDTEAERIELAEKTTDFLDSSADVKPVSEMATESPRHHSKSIPSRKSSAPSGRRNKR
jgi:transcriptional regulator with XRE-family HTH domain